jgi:predicted ATP-grasp superfamily ATP-dependent carboligase
MSVLVTNARSRIAYNVARSLGQKGIPVVAADFVRHSMAFSSRYVRDHFVYPSPFLEPERFLATVVDRAVHLNVKVLIPVFEETFLFAQHSQQLSPHVAFVLPDYAQILLAHNKDRWEALARRIGIPVPESYGADEVRGAAGRDVRYPVLVKPKQGGGAWGITHVESAQALLELLAQPSWAGKPWDRFFIQQKIDGHTHCVAMLFNHGQLRGRIGYRQIRDYPATGGQATLRVSVRHEQAERDLQRLLEDWRWHGPCQADFIVDQNGVAHLIDINPRLWGSLTQAIASGVDFPHLIYRLAVDGDVAPVASYQTGVVTRWLGGDLAALPSRLRFASDQVLVLKDFFFPKTPAALFDDFSWSDPLPLATWTADAVLRAIRFRSVTPVSHGALEGVWK